MFFEFILSLDVDCMLEYFDSVWGGLFMIF